MRPITKTQLYLGSYALLSFAGDPGGHKAEEGGTTAGSHFSFTHNAH